MTLAATISLLFVFGRDVSPTSNAHLVRVWIVKNSFSIQNDRFTRRCIVMHATTILYNNWARSRKKRLWIGHTIFVRKPGFSMGFGRFREIERVRSANLVRIGSDDAVGGENSWKQNRRGLLWLKGVEERIEFDSFVGFRPKSPERRAKNTFVQTWFPRPACVATTRC